MTVKGVVNCVYFMFICGCLIKQTLEKMMIYYSLDCACSTTSSGSYADCYWWDNLIHKTTGTNGTQQVCVLCLF